MTSSFPPPYTENAQGPSENEPHGCAGLIPHTFMMCGEGPRGERSYCSEACLRRDEMAPSDSPPLDEDQ